MPLTLSSPAFHHNEEIPQKYTCEGTEVSPPLDVSNPPEGTKSFALIVDDPDAPDPKAPKMTWIHWVFYNLPVNVSTIPEKSAAAPAGSLPGLNSWKKIGYGGPCPPIGQHRYFHKLYALDILLPDLKNPGKEKLLDAMKGHILEEATLIGLYQKRKH
ncbi:MAG: hypothetical protein A2X86_09490 [Bdellovibrionales bacterium GWA2_49_15]|nr:MAG: hypothetical protein A2X86_09490 [Bdellovibrionales bacterium GWA2_49_15]HAZ13012.1 YbhB/YbcL family Raf kinase inhibitor-like protein [Bdellovibrionales bacterium]